MLLSKFLFSKQSLVLSLFVCALFANTNALFAQTPISPTTWTGSPASATGPSGFTTLPATVIPGAATVGISQWDRNVVTFNAAGGCYNSTNWQVGGSLAAAQAANKYIYFTVSNSATTELQITHLFIRSQVSATGPQNVQVQYTIGAVTSNFGPMIATVHSASPENWDLPGNICLAPGQIATFKLYGWGGTSAAGTLRINDGTSITAGFATPVTATASNSSPICAGSPLSFTSTASGGIPGYTYSWAGPGGFTSAIPNPIILSPTAAASGVYTLTVTDALSCTTSSTPVTTTVTVNAAPSPITGTMIVCPGLTTTLSSTTVGGTWSSSNTAIANVTTATGIVTGVSAGTATITYMLSSLCVATATVTVDVPPAAITGSASLCQGTNTTLSSASPGGTWTSSDISIASVGAATGIVNGVSVGTATITYTISTGCFTTTIITVYPFPAAITGTAVVCEGATTTLSNTSAGGTWSSSNLLVATVTSATGVVTGVSGGTAIITYMLGGGCSSTRIVTVNPLPASIGGTPQVCGSFTRTFTNTTAWGTWSSSDVAIATIGASTGILFGVSAGTATISYILGTGCYTTTTITVNALPAPITGLSGVCIGSSVTLSNVTPGGTWSSSNTTVATIASATGILNGNVVGTSTISYTLTGTGCYVTRTETVHPLPNAITGSNTVCPGLTIALASTSPGGTWSSSNITMATVNAGTGVVTGVALAGGVATITYTLPTTCYTTKSITINPAPPSTITALGDTTFCPGDFVVLLANTGTGLTHQWFQGGTPIAGATGITHIASTTGSYQIRVTNGLGCPMMSIPMSVLVNTATATITVPGGTLSGCAATGVLLNANAGAGLTYQWLLGGIAIPGATGVSHTAVLTGDYTVQVINSTGCSAVSASVSITILPSPSTVVTLSGPATFCAGNMVSITGEAGMGYTYQWYNGAAPIAGATSISYTASTSGNYFVNITNSYGCSVASNVTNVISNPLPSVGIALSGPKVFCTGGAVTLNAVAGSYTYQWYKGGIALPGATASSYTAATSGTFRVRVTDIATGCTDITHADTIVTLVTTPTVLPLTPTKFCWGGSSLLSTTLSTVGFAVNYQWYLNGVAISGATNGTYAADVTGNYSCTIVVPGSCTTSTANTTVNEMPLPDPIITRTGATLKTGTHFISYQWYKNLIPITGATTATTIHTGNGNYKVRVTDTNGCQSVSDIYLLTGATGGTTGISTTELSTISVYPNPTQNVVYIDGISTFRVVISSIDGRKVIDEQNATSIDMSPFNEGVYILTLYSDNVLIKAEKIIKTAR